MALLLIVILKKFQGLCIQSMKTCPKLSFCLDPYCQNTKRCPEKIVFISINETVVNFAETYGKYHSQNKPSKSNANLCQCVFKTTSILCMSFYSPVNLECQLSAHSLLAQNFCWLIGEVRDSMIQRLWIQKQWVLIKKMLPRMEVTFCSP